MLKLGFFFLSPHTPYGSVRLGRFTLKTLTPRFTDFFTDFEKKAGCFAVTGKNIFLTFSRKKAYNTVKHQYYAVKSQYHLVQRVSMGLTDIGVKRPKFSG